MTDFCPVAVFSHNGKKLSMPTNRKQNKREFEIGEKIKIIYDKNKKEVYIYDAHDIKEAVIGMAVGIILIAALILQILLI